ncbi:transcriptional regulator [Lentibacillus kapialis]|uniref:Transcriptional regulator n=1 Tax=Lentibacillus kapialis TaxID=340214 RepID=A0A917PXH2_9BACI|nr:ROK family protein [Lentibacillus kapialis]GGJ97354.1 transcriptional regulator [Lentibacillus kapialis]
MKYYLSFDFGGTFIKYALVREDAGVSMADKVPTPASLEGLVDLVLEVSDDFRRHSDIEGIAVSCPGTITANGKVEGTSAISYLDQLALKDLLEERTGEQVAVENDANCAALAELWKGAARGCREVLTLVIGTGIGGAVISNGDLYRGANLYAGEFGYAILYADPKNKQVEHWSHLGSTSALIRKVAKEKDMTDRDISGEHIFEWAEEGDDICRQAIDDFYFMLAAGIHNLQHIYDPERILVGGGISHRDDFIPSLTEKVEDVQDLMDLDSIKPIIRTCQFKSQANLIGAAYHFIKSHNS